MEVGEGVKGEGEEEGFTVETCLGVALSNQGVEELQQCSIIQLRVWSLMMVTVLWTLYQLTASVHTSVWYIKKLMSFSVSVQIPHSSLLISLTALKVSCLELLNTIVKSLELLFIATPKVLSNSLTQAVTTTQAGFTIAVYSLSTTVLMYSMEATLNSISANSNDEQSCAIVYFSDEEDDNNNVLLLTSNAIR